MERLDRWGMGFIRFLVQYLYHSMVVGHNFNFSKAVYGICHCAFLEGMVCHYVAAVLLIATIFEKRCTGHNVKMVARVAIDI